jgi:hypothetical protein
MKKNTYDLLIEPKGPIYSGLLDYALGECRFFLLVIKDEHWIDQEGKTVLEELTPFLYKMEMKSQWPGTIIFGGEVPVYIYHFVPDSAEILKKSAIGLYQWQGPNLPDDLCLLRSDESPWLGTIAHEDDSYLELTEDEMHKLVKAIPELESMIRIHDES